MTTRDFHPLGAALVYALGKDVLVNGSGLNGAASLFGDRAYMFDGSADGLRESLRALVLSACPRPMLESYHPVVIEQRAWVESEFSDAAFAKRIAHGLEAVVR